MVSPMPNTVTDSIFISYRREDTRADAGRLCDRLENHFGDEQVFMDIDDIRPGQNFIDVLHRTLDGCDVMIVLIGQNWLGARDDEGSLRLDDEDDFVRLEVQSALQQGLEIIPVLVNRAQMPSAERLPAALAPLIEYQAMEISDSRFHQDVDRLIEVLESFARKGPRRRRVKRRWLLAVTALAGILLLAGFFYWPHVSDKSEESGTGQTTGDAVVLRSEPATMSGAEVKAMLVHRNFFDAEWYPVGTGLDHDFELSTVDGHGLVTDRRTRLMWQQSGSDHRFPFDGADDYIQGLNRTSFAGYTNWRLPTLEEAMSLLTPDTHAGAHISLPLSWRDVPVMWTADRAGEDTQWALFAHDGVGRPERRTFNAWVRAVRTID